MISNLFFSSGNQCRMILKKVKHLKIPPELKAFEDFLSNLNLLYIVSNSQLLCHNYCEVIDNFTESWVKLASQFKLSTTPKLHIIIDHLCDYFDETNLTLVKSSDEIVENCHQLFNKRLIKGFAVKTCHILLMVRISTMLSDHLTGIV